MNEKSANAIIYRLIDENCFTPDGRLAIYPEWLDHKELQSLVSIGVFREQHGNSDTYGHTDYFLVINQAVEHQMRRTGLQPPNHEHFYFPVRAGGPMRCVVCNARR